MFNFEKLEVWRRAIDFADQIYSVTEGFPDAERFGLTNQMGRAAVSVSSNIAEGSFRSSRTDFARLVEIGTGPLFEVDSQAVIARRRSFLPEPSFKGIYEAAEEECRSFSGLRASLLKSGS